MRQVFLFSLIVVVIMSCNEETSYQMQINLENDTEIGIEVTLYPKEEYLKGTLYKMSDFGGGYNQTNFVINADSDHGLFITKNLEIEPYELTRNIFDSIMVKFIDNSETVIKFSVDTVINYPDNLLDSNSTWNYVKIEANLPDMFNQNPVVIDNYTFVIQNVNSM